MVRWVATTKRWSAWAAGRAASSGPRTASPGRLAVSSESPLPPSALSLAPPSHAFPSLSRDRWLYGAFWPMDEVGSGVPPDRGAKALGACRSREREQCGGGGWASGSHPTTASPASCWFIPAHPPLARSRHRCSEAWLHGDHRFRGRPPLSSRREARSPGGSVFGPPPGARASALRRRLVQPSPSASGVIDAPRHSLTNNTGQLRLTQQSPFSAPFLHRRPPARPQQHRLFDGHVDLAREPARFVWRGDEDGPARARLLPKLQLLRSPAQLDARSARARAFLFPSFAASFASLALLLPRTQLTTSDPFLPLLGTVRRRPWDAARLAAGDALGRVQRHRLDGPRVGPFVGRQRVQGWRQRQRSEPARHLDRRRG